MTLRTFGRTLAIIALTWSSIAFAESQADIAARVNKEGEALAQAKKWADASSKFQDAIARVPEARYFYNLCDSRYHEGKFGEALTACKQVLANNPSDKLDGNTRTLIAKIRDDAKRQKIELKD